MSDISFNEYYNNEKVQPKNYAGRKIKSVYVKSNDLLITFADNVTIQISDEGQNCCEHRYMTTDDNLHDLIGKIFKDIVIKNVNWDASFDDESYKSESHQIAFMEIQTDKLSVSFATHNEHNGYYGGFSLRIKEIEIKEDGSKF